MISFPFWFAMFATTHSHSAYRLFKQVLKLVLPMAGSRLIQMIMSFVGMLMISHLGKTVLAAGALITSTMIATFIVMVSILFAVGVVVGHQYGAKNYLEIGKIIWEGCILALILVIPTLAIFYYVPNILLALKQSPQIIVYVKQYFHGLLWGVPAMLLLSSLQQALYGMLKQRIVITANMVCFIIFVPIAYILIFGKMRVPYLGVAGFAYAMDIVNYINVFVLVICFASLKDLKKVQLFNHRYFCKCIYLKQMLQIGWPMSLQFGGELIGFFVISIMIGWLGPNALAARQVTQQLQLLFVVPMFSLAESSGILVSQALGSKNVAKIRLLSNACLLFLFVLVVIYALFVLLIPTQLAQLFLNFHNINNLKILHLIKLLFTVSIFSLLFDLSRDVVTGSLRGLFDTRYAMLVGILAMWVVVIPVGYTFAFKLHCGVVGFRYAQIIAFSFGFYLVWRRWQQKLKTLF